MDKDQQLKYEELVRLCRHNDTFIFEGMLCRGNRSDVCKDYVKQNPSKTFYVWLIDNGYVINR